MNSNLPIYYEKHTQDTRLFELFISTDKLASYICDDNRLCYLFHRLITAPKYDRLYLMAELQFMLNKDAYVRMMVNRMNNMIPNVLPNLMIRYPRAKEYFKSFVMDYHNSVMRQINVMMKV
jgi:hypothetical protein